MIAQGVPGTSMPAFAPSAGGELTDAQVDALAQGLITTWGRPDAARDAALPPYASEPGEAGRGRQSTPRPARAVTDQRDEAGQRADRSSTRRISPS